MIIITILKGKMMTAKRFILNETSYHGQGAAAAIIDEIKSRGFNKALIVTDADLIKFGVVKKITDLLEAEGFAYAVFDGVKANPSVGVVKAGVEAFKAAGADYMIAVGGGSPQDTAAAMPTKLASSSEKTIRWWDISWAMVAGTRQAGASTLTLASPVKGK